MQRKIISLDKVSERTTIPLPTLRYYRSIGQGPRLWKLGGRIVAYEDDVDEWVREQYEAGQQIDDPAPAA